MCYRGGSGVVPTDESTSIRNCGDAIFHYMRPLQALAAYELTHDGCRRDCGDFLR